MIWTIIRTLTFLIIGLMNTALIKPEDIGTWENYVGYTFLLVAVLDAIYLSIILYMFSIISLIISIYQFLDKRIFKGALSLIFFRFF